MSKLNEHSGSSHLKQLLFETIHILLEDFQCGTFLPFCVLFLHYLQIFVILCNQNDQLFGSFSEFLNFTLPHRLDFDSSYVYFLIILGVILATIIAIAAGVYKSYQLRGNKNTIFIIVTHLIYFYQYVLFFIFSGLLLKLVKLNFSNLNLIFLVIAIILQLVLICFQFVISTFFFNFSFGSKDVYSRMPSYTVLILQTLRFGIFVIDIFIESNSKINILMISTVVYTVCEVTTFLGSPPYIHYDITMLNLFLVAILAWINFSLLLAMVLNVQIINDHLLAILVVGIVFIIGNFWYYFLTLFQYLVNKSISTISNQNIMEKQIRYFHQLIELSSKSKVDELMLASIIQLHVENCAKPLCICKNRQELYDPIRNAESDTSVPIFKDPVFLKNFLLMIIQESTDKFSNSRTIQIVNTLYQLEQFENFSQVNQQLYNFQKKETNISLQFEMCIDRISRKLVQRMKDRNRLSPYSKDTIEDIFMFDKYSDQLKESIFEIIENYSMFWDLLSDSINEIKKISGHCRTILRLKKQIKNYLNKINSITKNNDVMTSLIEFYFNCVISEPEKAIKMDQRKRSILEMKVFNSDKDTALLNLFDDNCFVFNVSINLQSAGQILWVSKNSSFLTNYDDKMLCSMNINSLMPKLIANNHTAFIKQYLKDCKNKMMGNLNKYCILDSKKKLLAADIIPKLIWNERMVTAISYFRIDADKSKVIVNGIGEIDSFGENFCTLSGLHYDIGFHMSNMSILLMMPQLLVLFLPNFYDLPNFLIEDFNYDLLKTTFFFVYKGLKNKLMELSRLLHGLSEEFKDDSFDLLKRSDTITKDKKAQGKSLYCSKLYNFLKALSFEEVEEVLMVNIDTRRSITTKAGIKQEFWLINVFDFTNVTSEFKKEHFDAQFTFLEKININEVLKYSLGRYHIRKEKNEPEKDIMSSTVFRNKSKKNIRALKEVINKKKNDKAEESELMEDEMKRKATDIIRNLFVKSFDLPTHETTKSPYVQMMVRAINTHNTKKNNNLIIVVNTQIEKLPSNFKEDLFCGYEIVNNAIRKRDKNALASFELRKQRRAMQKNMSIGSVRSVSSTHSQSDINFLFKTKIKQNLKMKKKKLRLVIGVFAFSVLFYLGFNLFMMSSLQSNEFLTFSNFLDQKFLKLYSIFSFMTSLTSYSNFHANFVFPELTDLRELDKVLPENAPELIEANLNINTGYKYLNESLDGLIHSEEFYNVTQNNQIIKDLFIQASWKLDSIDYITSLFEFILLFKYHLKIDYFFKKDGVYDMILMPNFKTFITSLQSYESFINKNISVLFDESMNSVLIYSFIM